MEPVRWGILSTAKIGTEKVIPGMLKSKPLEVIAMPHEIWCSAGNGQEAWHPQSLWLLRGAARRSHD